MDSHKNHPRPKAAWQMNQYKKRQSTNQNVAQKQNSQNQLQSHVEHIARFNSQEIGFSGSKMPKKHTVCHQYSEQAAKGKHCDNSLSSVRLWQKAELKKNVASI